MSQGSSRTSRVAVWACALLLAVFHQDFWWWKDRTLVLGFLPIGLFYHALFSLGASALWIAAVRFAWPAEIEAWAEGKDAHAVAGGARNSQKMPGEER